MVLKKDAKYKENKKKLGSIEDPRTLFGQKDEMVTFQDWKLYFQLWQMPLKYAFPIMKERCDFKPYITWV